MKLLFIQSESESIAVQMLSSYLKQRGHEVDLFFDAKVFSSSFLNLNKFSRHFDLEEVMLHHIKTTKPDIIGFSILTDDYQWAIAKAALIKQHFDIPIIFGGHHVNTAPDRVIEHPAVDYICVGEGEDPMAELMDDMAQGGDGSSIANIWLKKDGQVVRNPMRMLETDLDKFPFPDKSLFYDQLPQFKDHYATIFSRGCCYTCTYCCNNVLRNLYKGLGKYLRFRSPQNCIDELVEAERRYAPKHYGFVDDMLTADINWFREFATLYKKYVNKPYICYAHPKFFNEEVGRLLKESGCHWLNFGLQSGSEQLRKSVLGRRESNEDIVKACELCNKLGLTYSIDHIFGIPFETEDDLEYSLNLYNEIQPKLINAFFLNYYPKAAIIDSAIQCGILQESDTELIVDGKRPSVMTMQIGSTGDKKDAWRIYNKYLFSFVLLCLLPKRTMDWIIARKLNNAFSKLPPILIAFPKIFLKIKLGHAYIYTGEIKRIIFNARRARRLRKAMQSAG